MDPEVALQRLRDMASRVQFGDVDFSREEFAEQFVALDEWLSRGGFAPAVWGGPGVRLLKVIVRLAHYSFDPVAWDFSQLTTEEQAIIGDAATLKQLKELYE